MSWFKKKAKQAVHGVKHVAKEVDKHTLNLQRLFKMPKAPEVQAPGEEEEEGIEFPDYSEAFAQMQDALRAQAEAAAFVPDEQEPLKNAVSESSEAEDDLKRKQQRRSGVLSLYKRYLDSGYAWNGGGTGTALGGTSALGA